MSPAYQLATFATDVTCPIGHPLMSGLRPPASTIDDPLQAHGFVLLGAGDPIVVAAIDWCEIRNQSYRRWREALAKAAGTEPERVMLCSVHQHDAPVSDLGAEAILATEGLGGATLDATFQESAIQAVATALEAGLQDARTVTHVGLGRAKVAEVASNRRVVMPDGQVSFLRTSHSAGDPVFRDAPEGMIDQWLQLISFWEESEPVLALHAYSTHPMSHYGMGAVSADFVGMARSRRQQDEPDVHQIYVSGCSGDTTAGKFNDGSPEHREVLASRLHDAMVEAWRTTERHPLGPVSFRAEPLGLEFRKDEEYTTGAMRSVVMDPSADTRDRILAAMGLNSRITAEREGSISMPCLDLGPAMIVLFPAEAFVDYQLMAQRMRPDAFVMSIGYGESWPGYIPTDEAFQDGFDDHWLWIAPGAEGRIRGALYQLLHPVCLSRTPLDCDGATGIVREACCRL